MNTKFRPSLISCVLTLGSVLIGPSLALGSILVTPAWSPKWTSDQTSAINSQSEMESAFAGFDLDYVISPLYKSDFVTNQVLGTDSSSFASSYNTTFGQLDDDNEPSGATILHLVGETHIDFENVFLLVKDGPHNPAQYLFDISGWDGLTEIELADFWPNKGAISHVAIWGGGNPLSGPPPGVPEPTSVAVWSLIVGLATFLTARRK